jgi:hypothetical protein
LTTQPDAQFVLPSAVPRLGAECRAWATNDCNHIQGLIVPEVVTLGAEVDASNSRYAEGLPL